MNWTIKTRTASTLSAAAILGACTTAALAILPPGHLGMLAADQVRKEAPPALAPAFDVETPIGDARSAGGAAAGGGAAGEDGCGNAISQLTDPTTISQDSALACAVAGVGTSDNGWARSFPAGQLTSICAVDFAIRLNTEFPWQVSVNIYSGGLTNPTLIESRTVHVPMGPNQFLRAHFHPEVNPPSDEPVIIEVYAESKLVADGGPGGSIRLGENALGQSAPSYLRSNGCGLVNFTDAASIGFPTSHFIVLPRDGESIGACCLDGVGTPCPGDINESGAVDVFDLLALLGCWGAVQPGCETADLTASGAIDVFDLLQLLANWGPCPEGGPLGCQPSMTPTDCTAAEGTWTWGGVDCDWPDVCAEEPLGACCFGDTSCELLTEAECGDGDGTFHGAFVSCDAVNCPLEAAFSCEGNCFGSAPSGCGCADECFDFDDCCVDACEICELDHCSSCEGNCGGTAPLGCECDEACCLFLDCCDDKFGQCGGCDPTPLPVECPPGSTDEGEPCGQNTNGGCNSDPVAYGSISCGETICGTVWADGGTRDLDWFSVTIDSEQDLTVTGEAQFPAQVWIMNDQCGDDLVAQATGWFAPNEPISLSACLPAGTYVIVIGPASSQGAGLFDNLPCGSGHNDYFITLDCPDCE